MLEDYPQEKLQEIYEALPNDLKEALFSEENAGIISDICRKNGLEDKNEQVAKYIGYVLLGLLPPADLEKTLKEKLILSDDLTKKVYQEINRLVFIPLKPTLEMLYKTELAASPAPTKPPEEKPGRGRPRKDTYRETIE